MKRLWKVLRGICWTDDCDLLENYFCAAPGIWKLQAAIFWAQNLLLLFLEFTNLNHYPKNHNSIVLKILQLIGEFFWESNAILDLRW